MKFTVHSNEMKAAMSLVTKAIASKNPLPILGCVKLTQNQQGNLEITGGDEETMMTITIPMIETQEFQPICIEASILSEMLGSIGKQPVTFEVKGKSVTLIYATGHFNVAVMSADEFPVVDDNIEAVDCVIMQADELSKGIAMCRVFSGNDVLRPIMSSVYLDMTGDHLVMAATDSCRLIRKGFPEVKTGGKTGSIITTKTASLLSAYQRPVEIAIRVNERQTAFIADGFRLIAKNLEGRYPNYNAVIPKSNPTKVEVGRNELSTSLKRAMITGNKGTSLVKIELSTLMGAEGQMAIEGRDIDFARSGQDVISCTHNYKSGTFSIGFKGTLLQEILATHTTSKVAIELADPSRAAVIRDIDGDPNLLTLIMPMQLIDEI